MRRRVKRPGFTLIELLVVVAIIAVLIAILLPALTAAREASKLAVCQGKIHQIALAISAYANDWDDCLPCIYYLSGGTTPWNHYTYQLRSQVKDDADIFSCPSGKARPASPIQNGFRYEPDPGLVADYGINTNFHYSHHYKVSRLEHAWGYLADVETPPDDASKWYRWVSQIRFTHNWDQYYYWWTGVLSRRHRGGSTVLFTDFHVEWQPFGYWYLNDAVFGTGDLPDL